MMEKICVLMVRNPILEYLSVVRNKKIYIYPKEKAKVNYYKVLKGDY
jgi:ABC-type Fe2+-enterobactin transport system substrate-binding protein